MIKRGNIIARTLHKWVGLLIGLQVLIWALSGLMLSLLNPEKVSGEKWVKETTQSPRVIQDSNLLEPLDLTAEQLEGALSVNLEVRRGQTVYRVHRQKDNILINASSGVTLLTNKNDAKILAQQDFTGVGDVVSIESGEAPDLDKPQQGWRLACQHEVSRGITLNLRKGTLLTGA